MKKKPVLYVVILCLWACCLGVLWFAYAKIVARLHGYTVTTKILIIVLLTINTVALSALWLGSVKDLTFSVAYAVLRKKLEKRYAEIKEVTADNETAPRFLLLYCTCNDFNAAALSACRKQDYPNFTTIILDDSSKPGYINEITVTPPFAKA